MIIKTTCTNCDYENQFLTKEWADSKIELSVELTELVSRQSRKSKRDALVKTIAEELSKFKWLISGAVSIEFYWYLSHYDRHETDTSADLDNLTKPISDSLIGENAILIDDCQIRELYIEWISKNEAFESSHLNIWINFNNDYSLIKNKLFFVQYHNAMCAAFDTDFSVTKNIFGMKMVLWTKKKWRRIAAQFPGPGSRMPAQLFTLTFSPFDYHRTRLQKFSKGRILSVKEFNRRCDENGLGFRELLRFMRMVSRSNVGTSQGET